MTLTATMEPLKRLEFLIGRWRSRSENQFGVNGVIEGTLECTHEPGEKFIAFLGDAHSEGKILHKEVAYLLWDQSIKKYVRKSIFSYGWILNEVGEMNGDRLTLEVVHTDGEPDYFKGTRWRSFIQRYSENEIGTGLEVAKNDEPFRLYGESKARRIQTR